MRMDKKCMVMTRITKGSCEEEGGGSEGDKCERDKVMVRREAEKLCSRPAAFGLNGVQMKNGDEIIRQAD